MKRTVAISMAFILMLIPLMGVSCSGDGGNGDISWSSMSSGTTEWLSGIWGSSSSDVYATGDSGTILHYNGSTWSSMSSGTTQHLRRIWGSSSSDVFIVGFNGTILHHNGSTWSPMSSGTTVQLHDVWGSSSSNIFVVGEAGTILNYDGSTWSPMSSGTTELLGGIWGTSSTDVFTVGDNGTILHYNGSTWSSMDSGTTEGLWKIWGSSSSDVFTIGSNGAILHYNGNTWSPMSSDAEGQLEGIWGSSSSNVFVVGSTILHYDGSTWSPMSSGTNEWLGAIWGSSSSDIFAVGDKGTILHYSSSSSTSIAGTYINQADSSAYIELSEDGTFYAEEEEMEFTGEWEVEGNEISFYWDDSVTTGTIEDNKIIEDDIVWIKQANGSEPATYKSSDIGADGGELELTTSDNTTCSLTIPSGVLTETTNIKITAESSSSGSSLGALSNDFLLEPEGLEFDTPVTVAITVPDALPSDGVPAILHTTADGQSILLETQVDGQTLTASLTHFSSLSPVDPTAEQLQFYWDATEREIEDEGLSVELVSMLIGAYNHAYFGGDVYDSIDLIQWGNRLWQHVYNLINMGSTECSNGNYVEAENILNHVLDFIIMSWLLPDLKAEAEQALQDCQQNYLLLSVNSWPKIYYRIKEVNWATAGLAEIFINDELAMRGFHDPFGIYNVQQKQVGSNNFYKWIEQNGCLTFKFVLRQDPNYPLAIPRGYFEVEVDGQIVYSKQLAGVSNTDTLEETLTLVFPNVSPP